MAFAVVNWRCRFWQKVAKVSVDALAYTRPNGKVGFELSVFLPISPPAEIQSADK
jgi:hypothetical protein